MRRPLTGRRARETPALRRSVDALPPRAAEAGLFSGRRRPLRRALKGLEPHELRITRAWTRLLRRLEPSADEHATLLGLDLGAAYRHLALGGRAGGASGHEAYRAAIERGAESLMLASVPEGQALGAVALYLEACLGYVECRGGARALARLTMATQQLVAAGYVEDRVAELRRRDDRERQVLAADLHDEVGADLVVLKLYVEMIAGELPKSSLAPLRAKLRETLALIAHAIESVRRLSLDLGPAFLDTLGFLPALRSVVRQFSLRTGIDVSLVGKPAPGWLPPSQEIGLYRVLRGALSNVAKHSEAQHVTVTLRRAGGVFQMNVEDDGKGFDVRAAVPNNGVGLMAMRQRVRGFGGSLRVESRMAGRRGARSGTRVEVRLPLRGKAAA